LPGTASDYDAVNLVFPLLPAVESKLKEIRNSMVDLRDMIY
jgi:hypothetical protein